MRLHPQTTVDEYTRAGLWGQDTWDVLLAKNVAAQPDAISIVDPANRDAITDGPPRELTWAELSDLVDRLAVTLLDAGIGIDDVVGVQLPNSVELSAALLAITSIGAIASPLPVQYREYELEQLAELAKFRAFVTVSRVGSHRLVDSAVTVKSSVPGLTTVFAFGDNLPAGAVDMGAASAEVTDFSALREHRATFTADPNDCVTICWTSGTESTPKAVPRCPNDWYGSAMGSVSAAALTRDDVLLNPFPMVNMAGIAGMFLPWLMTGATLVQHHPFDAPTFFGQLMQRKVTYTVAPPALLTRALASDAASAGVFDSVRVIGSGSAPLSPHMIGEYKERFDIEINNCFGSNEGTCLVGDQVTVPELGRRAVYFPRFGSPDHTWDNTASLGMDNRLVDLATEEEITTAGVPGELRIKGPQVFSGYLAGTASSSPFDKQGYFATGDIFQYVADETGDLRYLQYVDRAKDLIVRGGMNISPAELESMLAGHPAVAEAAVIGIPDTEMGERVAAVIVASGDVDPTLEDILSFLRAQNIAAYKLPESLTVLDELPRNPVGKVAKRDLRTMVVAVSSSASKS
ncbi:2,3-dihydroxybenzoate-AMP ligase [Rhodococcus sp. SRB_17]|nr:2,3-dihydroxybenzoate-AMP ligase [Rhodococcus sp. SRB_17]